MNFNIVNVGKDIIAKGGTFVTKNASQIKAAAKYGITVVKKASPDILTVAGVGAIGAGTVMACKATLDLPEILDEAHTRLDKIDNHWNTVNTEETPDEYPEKEMKTDKLVVFADAGQKIVKLYFPSVTTIILGIAAVLAGHGILKKRAATLGLMYDSLQKVFNEYRERVIADAGIDKDIFYRTGYEKKNIKTLGPDEEVKDVKKANVLDEGGDIYSVYARIFDEGNENWSKDPTANLVFLRARQQFWNDKLRAEGIVFLNDVYHDLGFSKTKTGQLVGWKLDNPNGGDEYIDFGIYDKLYVNSAKREFLNGAEPAIWLDFNVDGLVYDLL